MVIPLMLFWYKILPDTGVLFYVAFMFFCVRKVVSFLCPFVCLAVICLFVCLHVCMYLRMLNKKLSGYFFLFA